MGAERAGNADGSIPAWDGGLPTDAGATQPGGSLSDPFAAEKPLFTITAQNLEQYRERLSTGQQALFKRYPASYRMPVYPSHRSASLPEPVYQAIARNAVKAQLVAGGNGLQDFETATPFPIPQNGLEVVWNHITRYRGGSARRTHAPRRWPTAPSRRCTSSSSSPTATSSRTSTRRTRATCSSTKQLVTAPRAWPVTWCWSTRPWTR